MTNRAVDTRPDDMRRAVRQYVRALHAAYFTQIRSLPPGEFAHLLLPAANPLTVAAVAARQLHLIAVAGELPAPVDCEPDVADVLDGAGIDGVNWLVRFYDPSVVPALGLLPDDEPAAVRRVLGIGEPLYHLVVSVGGGLDEHHAQHSGVALASEHTRTERQLDRLRYTHRRNVALVDELAVCVRLGLDHAAAALTTRLSSGRVTPSPGTSATRCLQALLDEPVAR